MPELHPLFPRAAHDAVAHFAPLISVIAAIANGDTTRRAEIEYLLPQLDNNGWHISAAVQRIWAGERDRAALTSGLDSNSAAIISATLDAIEHYAPDPEADRIAQVIASWRPVILTVAAAALDINQARQDIDGFLPQLEQQDEWQTLAQRIRLILAGSTQRERLLADLDPTDTVIIAAILHAIDDPDNLVRLLRDERNRAAAEED